MENITKLNINGVDYQIRDDVYNSERDNLATKEELNTKQDVLVSGTNIKTINNNSLLGEGNIDIQIDGGVDDAPTDGNKYVRQDGNWVRETLIDTESFATKEELDAKVDDSEISDMATQTWVTQQGFLTEHQNISNLVTKSELTEGLETKQDKGDYLLTATAEATYQPIGEYATVTQLNDKVDKADGKSLISDTEIERLSTVVNYDDASIKSEIQTLKDDKADKTELTSYLTSETAEATYAKKSELHEEYTLPIASDSVLGGIKVGSGLQINPDSGILSATGGGTADAVDWNNITSKPNTFTPSSHTHLSNEITDLEDKLDTKQDVGNYLTVESAQETYQPKGDYLTEIPSEYITESELESKGYLTEHQDISQLATKQELTEGLSSKQPTGDYATTTQFNENTENINKINTSCGFDGGMSYQPQNELITGATSLSQAIELIANKASSGSGLPTSTAGFSGKLGISKSEVFNTLLRGECITISFDTDDSGGYNTAYFVIPFAHTSNTGIFATCSSYTPRSGIHSFTMGKCYITSSSFTIDGEEKYTADNSN